MTELWTWFLTTKVGRFLAGVAAVVIALGVAALIAFGKGKKSQAAKDAAANANADVEQAQQVQQAANARQEVENENAALPEAPPQTVANAAPGTAAGDLRDDGWVRGTEDPNGH
jgi:hypothetical protein